VRKITQVSDDNNDKDDDQDDEEAENSSDGGTMVALSLDRSPDGRSFRIMSCCA
jgi:hypothetical protein